MSFIFTLINRGGKLRYMKQIKCAGVIFIDGNHKILLEDRRRINKHGEHWSFFGGSVEKGETIKNCLLREVKEELNYDLKKYKFFLKYVFQVKDLNLTYYMYIAKTPDLKKLKVHKKASLKKLTIKQVLRLKITPADKEILRKLQIYLSNE